MQRYAVLLRGINLGPRNRIAMAELRETFSEAGFEDVRTYLQSGNMVLSSDAAEDRLVKQCERLISEHFGLDIRVVVRTRKELADVVRRDPLGDVVTSPKRYQVSFLARKLDRRVAEQVSAAAVEPEQVVVRGREIYAWHPDGIARSKLWALLAGKTLGTPATARNWATVTALLELAGD